MESQTSARHISSLTLFIGEHPYTHVGGTENPVNSHDSRPPDRHVSPPQAQVVFPLPSLILYLVLSLFDKDKPRRLEAKRYSKIVCPKPVLVYVRSNQMDEKNKGKLTRGEDKGRHEKRKHRKTNLTGQSRTPTTTDKY